ncbi:ABC transporter ATP-binding protein [Pelagibacterales bacterium SAG-MED32]|nr:ABC transporter ATP-binding protein [Pelagibacterales bacterium SAG-MED32]
MKEQLIIFKRVFREILVGNGKALSIIIMIGFICAIFEILSIGMIIPIISITLESGNEFNAILLTIVNKFISIENNHDLLILVAICFSITVFIGAFMRTYLIYIQSKFSTTLIHDVNIKIYESIFRRKYVDHVKLDSSELISTIVTKVNQVAYQVLVPLIHFMSQIIIILFISTTLIYINASIFFIMLSILAFVYFFIIKSVSKKLDEIGKSFSSSSNMMSSLVRDAVLGFREIVLLKKETFFENRFEKSDYALRRSQHLSNIFTNAPRILIESVIIFLLMTYVIISVLYSSSNENILFVAEIAAIVYGAQKLIPLFNRVYQDWAQISANLKPMEDVLDLYINHHNPIKNLKNNHEDHPPEEITFSNMIKCEDLSFNYSTKQEKLISKLNFSIKKNEWFCIFGPTGCGKSTLLDLIAGLIEPKKGKILIDGIKLNSSNIRSWQNKISYVSQKIFLLNGTIAENVAFGFKKEEIDNDRVIECLQTSELMKDINGFEANIQTFVGENGKTLSGGQIQRLGIARALYINKEIMILDEATSSLDHKNESKILTNIKNKHSNSMTIIAITHKKQILENFNNVLNMEKSN